MVVADTLHDARLRHLVLYTATILRPNRTQPRSLPAARLTVNNPYETPTFRPEKRGPFPWMLLAAILFAMLLFMGFLLWRTMTFAQVARERERAARAEMSEARAMEAMQQAELDADNE